jgi:hypothetical protein
MIAKDLVQELKSICDNLTIHDAYSYTFHDVLYAVTPTSTGDATKNPRLALIQSIAQQLYDQCYIRDIKQSKHGNDSRSMTEVDHVAVESAKADHLQIDLTASLKQVNTTTDEWDRGWKIYQMAASGKIFVQKAERSRAALAGAYASETMKSHGLQIGDLVSLRVYSANSELQAAFFHSFGRQLADQFDDYSAVRLYFNIDAESAATLLAELSSLLNQYYVPFHFKTLVDSRQYGRADSAVLYIARRYYQFVVSLLAHLPALLGSGLHDPVPMFCQRIMRGVGVAEDPGTGESFGMHRCRVVAEGLVAAWEDGLQTIDERLKSIENRFEIYDLILEKPYLNPFSLDIFAPVGMSAEASI